MTTSDSTKLSNLQKRILIGVPGAALITSCILYSDWSFFLLVFVLHSLCLFEFYRLINRSRSKTNLFTGLLFGISLIVYTALVIKMIAPIHYALILVVALPILLVLELYRKNETPFLGVAWTFMGIGYITLPLVLMMIIPFMKLGYNPHAIFPVFVITWVNDIGAFFIGKLLGRHKLSPKWSPNKTWEGTIGGSLLSFAAALSYCEIFKQCPYDLTCLIAIAAIVSITGTLGDLIESMLKRSVPVKDSGNSLPGHGGFLDRFDTLFISVPFVFLYLLLFG